MDENINNSIPTDESILKAMELAWKDHHHARDQTWKTVQMVFVLGAGLLTVDLKYEKELATILMGVLVLFSSFSGILITWHHRKLERRKFIHLMNCEEKLGLHRNDLIPLHKDQKLVGSIKKTHNTLNDKYLETLIDDSSVKVPEKFGFIEVINPLKNNTALFILRLHISIFLFSVIVILLRSKIL